MDVFGGALRTVGALCVRGGAAYDRSVGVRPRVWSPSLLGVQAVQQHRRMDPPLWVRIRPRVAELLAGGADVSYFSSPPVSGQSVLGFHTIPGASVTPSTMLLPAT